jgi:hypothetical protein
MAWAHDAPANVTVHMQLRAEGGAMRVLARIPLEAVRDVDFPAIAGGYLDVAALQPRLAGLAQIWVADKVTLLEDGVAAGRGRVVGTQISVESDRSFTSFDLAAAHLREPLPANEEKLFWKQVYFDVELTIPVRRADGAFALKPDFADLGEKVQTVLHYDGSMFLLPGEQEAFPLRPSWTQAAWLFVKMGFLHILDGKDHLLFVLCLVIPVRRLRPLVWVVTAFTAAHSLTLIASALGMAPDGLWFPPMVELGIAVSIVLLALGNILGWEGHGSWMLAFVFGLVHGFGFSFALRESLQFAGGHLAAALLAFNVGVELGQLAALAVMVPVLALLFRKVEERMGTVVLSALVAHTGGHWMWERWEVVGRYSIAKPELSLVLFLKWVLGGMALWAVWWWRRMKI